MQAFSIDLYQQLASTAAGNLVCSPYSVAVALAMARNGAVGQTANEMDDVLHAPDLHQMNEGLNSLMLLVQSRAGEYKGHDGSKLTIALDVANSLWGQRGEAWEHSFLEALARYYATGMRQVDYITDTESARLAINRWTSGQTHGKIPELVPPNVLSDQTRLLLVNAIYLKAPWDTPFDKELTRNKAFTFDNGRRVSVPTMGMTGMVPLTEGNGWRAGRLPYVGGTLAMTVVVPTSTLAELDQGLDAAALRAIISDPVPTFMTVWLPKWKVRLNAGLKKPLSALGMPTAFDRKSADFSGMTHEEPLWIKDVQHDAFISVDEKGTEAAAATAVMMMDGSSTPPPLFIVDRPFLFIIHDVAAATPLFIGRVADPSAT